MIVKADRSAESRIAQVINVAYLLRALRGGPVANSRSAVFDSSLPHRDDGVFVGRLRLQELLLEHVNAERRLSPIHVCGHGGIGKTALLRRVLGLVPDSVYIDLAFVRSSLDLVRRLTGALSALEFGFGDYAQECDRYAELERDLLSRPGLSSQAILQLSKLSDLRPTGQVHGGAHADPFYEEGNLQSAQIVPILEVLAPTDRDFYVDPLPVVTRAFISDLDIAGRKFCVALDRTERAPAHLGEWLWRRLLPECRSMTLVTAGRDDVSRVWRLPPGLVRVRELGPLSETEARELVGRIGIRDDARCATIVASSRGIPLALELAAETVNSADLSVSDGAMDAVVVDQMVKVFMEELTTSEREALQRLAIFRHFNRETINELHLGDEKALNAMLAFRFVKHVEHGYTLHDSVRDFILRDLRRQEPGIYRTLHAQAAEYYRSRPGPFAAGGFRFLEWLYHVLSAGGPDAFEQLRGYFTAASLAIRPDFCSAVIGLARDSDVDGELPQLWLRFFEGAVMRQRFDFEGCEEVYQEILRDPHIEFDAELKAELLYQRSVALWYLCDFDEGLKVARASVALNRRLGKKHFENRSHLIVGLTLDRMGQFAAAIRTVRGLAKRARADDPVSEAYALSSVGYFSWHSGDWRGSENALLACRDRWISLENPLGECYPVGHVGLLYTGVRQYALAWELLERNRHMCQVAGNPEMASKTWQNLSVYHRRTGDFAASVECGEKALEISHRLKHPYYQADTLRILCETYLDIGDLDRAREKVTAGLAALADSKAIYRQSRLQVLRLTVDVASYLKSGDGDSRRLGGQLDEMTESCVRHGFRNVAADVIFTSLRLSAAIGIQDLVALFSRGAGIAFAYNWYVGMDYLERVQGLGIASLASALTDGYAPPRLYELHDSPGSRTLKSFRATELEWIDRFGGPR